MSRRINVSIAVCALLFVAILAFAVRRNKAPRADLLTPRTEAADCCPSAPGRGDYEQ